MEAMITFQFLGKVKRKPLFPRQDPQGIETDFILLLPPIQVNFTPTLSLPHQGGGGFGAPPMIPPPLVGGGSERGIKKEIPIQLNYKIPSSA
jgi:hypothetical protein